MSDHPETILKAFAAHYREKTTPGKPFSVQIHLRPGEEIWSIHFGLDNAPRLDQEEEPGARFHFTLSHQVLADLSSGKLSPLTAMGRAKMSDPAPLDFKLGDGLEMSREIYLELIAFVQRFFNPTFPEEVPYGLEHSRVVHGGHAAVLFYGEGFRSAWYQLNPGERLNEEGDTNPFPQAFVFLSGKGTARIGEESLEVEAGKAYRIPPGTDHTVFNPSDEPLTLLFLAWGEGA